MKSQSSLLAMSDQKCWMTCGTPWNTYSPKQHQRSTWKKLLLVAHRTCDLQSTEHKGWGKCRVLQHVGRMTLFHNFISSHQHEIAMLKMHTTCNWSHQFHNKLNNHCTHQSSSMKMEAQANKNCQLRLLQQNIKSMNYGTQGNTN